MKKSIRLLGTVSAAAIALSMGSMLPASAESAASMRIMGDMNKDMTVDVADAQATLQFYVSTIAGNAESAVTTENEAADIDMDGEIGLEDATAILNYYCQTLAGGQPLWAEYRKVSYQNGNDFAPVPVMVQVGEEPVYDENGEVITNIPVYEKLLDENGDPVMRNQTFALRGMYLEVGCASGKAGETVTVPVYIAGVPDLAGFQLSLSHDLPLELLEIDSKIDEQPGWNPNSHPECNPKAEENLGIIVAAQAYNVSLADGFVIAEFTYRIPEDAKSGDHYALTLDQSWTKFVSSDCTFVKASDTEIIENGAYQYTALDGVVTVK